MSIQQAIVFNNSGVYDLHRGKLTDGIQSMRQAIALLRDLSEPRQVGVCKRPSKASTAQLSSSSSAQARQGEQYESMNVDEPTLGQLPSIRLAEVEWPGSLDRDAQSSVLFNHAIFLDSHVSEDDHEIVCCCVLFNMALAHHIQGLIPTSLSRNTWMNKALQLYHIVLRILERLPQDLSPSSEILTLGTLNNAAHIHSVNFDHDSVFNHVNAMNLVLSRAGASNVNHVLSYFAMNSIFYKEKHQVAPAA